MRSVSPLAAATIDASLFAALPWPMFSPAEFHETPAAVKRSPRPASPGHWCERPQPPTISALWAAAAFDRFSFRTYGVRLFAVRAALMWASTWSITVSAGAVVTGALVG